MPDGNETWSGILVYFVAVFSIILVVVFIRKDK